VGGGHGEQARVLGERRAAFAGCDGPDDEGVRRRGGRPFDHLEQRVAEEDGRRGVDPRRLEVVRRGAEADRERPGPLRERQDGSFVQAEAVASDGEADPRRQRDLPLLGDEAEPHADASVADDLPQLADRSERRLLKMVEVLGGHPEAVDEVRARCFAHGVPPVVS
jgi:hypothetical protein